MNYGRKLRSAVPLHPAQVFGESFEDRGLHAEDRQDLCVAQADQAVVQHLLQGELLRVLSRPIGLAFDSLVDALQRPPPQHRQELL